VVACTDKPATAGRTGWLCPEACFRPGYRKHTTRHSTAKDVTMARGTSARLDAPAFIFNFEPSHILSYQEIKVKVKRNGLSASPSESRSLRLSN